MDSDVSLLQSLHGCSPCRRPDIVRQIFLPGSVRNGHVCISDLQKLIFRSVPLRSEQNEPPVDQLLSLLELLSECHFGNRSCFQKVCDF